MAELGYIDPNPEGLDMINNEDLSIFVELTSTKKERAEINVDNESKTYKLQKGGEKVPIRLLGGNDIDGDGNKELTTHYTEINTNFNESTPNLETLGITSIDIDFNSSYTPMIKIKFVDVRGKLFEMGNESPYDIFFNLPYPMFKLTVKGYYGKAVNYCLHLTKFTGKLDDKTGNFDIQCEFIGYTYAFLSDMLMGVLRGIVGTRIGKKIIEKTKNNNKNFLPFDELNRKMVEIDKNIEKLKEDDNDLAKIALGESTLENMRGVKDVIISFIRRISELEKDLIYNKNNFILYKKPSEGENLDTIINKKDNYNNKIEDLISEINKATKSTPGSRYYLKPESFKLNESSYATDIRKIDFKPIELWGDGVNGYLVKGLEYENEPHNISNIIVNNVGIKSEGVFNNESYYEEFRNIVNNISSNKINDDTNMIVFDFRKSINKINEVSKTLKDDLEDSRKSVSDKLVGDISSILGFESNIKNIIYILTEHVHILMKSLKRVGQEVIDSQSGGERGNQLSEVVVNKNSDVANTSETECSNGNISSGEEDFDINDILPFPDYKESNEEGIFEDKWIGDVAPEIPEVRFIEDLLESLLQARKDDDKTSDYLDDLDDEWCPVNPFDTSLMSDNGNPWIKFQDNAEKTHEVIRHLVLRMSIFLGYSNNRLTDKEVEAMAKIEAKNLYEHTINENIKDNLLLFGSGNSSTDSFYNSVIEHMGDNYTGDESWFNATKPVSNGYFNLKSSRLVGNKMPEGTQTEDKYFYIGESENPKEVQNPKQKWYLPLSSKGDINFYNGNKLVAKSNGDILTNPVDDDFRISLRDSGDVFFSSEVGGNHDEKWYNKVDDGSTTIDIISVSEYEKKQGPYPDGLNKALDKVNTDPTFNLTNLSDLEENGISKYSGLFGGKWGTREIRVVKMDEPIEKHEGLIDSWYRFFGNTPKKPFFTGERTMESDGGTAFDIHFNPANNKISTNTGKGVINCGSTSLQTITMKPSFRTSNMYGKTIDVLVNRNKNDDKNVAIPFLGFETCSPKDKTDRWYNLTRTKYNELDKLQTHYPIFGSELYYNQTNEGKAYLFLHSIPWNGLTNLTKYGAKSLSTKDFNVGEWTPSVIDFHLSGYEKNYTGLKDNKIKGTGMANRGAGLFTHHIQHFFKHSSAFIEAPYLWVCFVGSLLWRFREKKDPIVWEKDGYGLIPLQKRKSPPPTKDEYCLPNINGNDGMGFFVAKDDDMESYLYNDFSGVFNPNKANNQLLKYAHLLRNEITDGEDVYGDAKFSPYVSIEKTIRYMPKGMGDKFIKMFKDFVNTEFKGIRREYDIFLNEEGEDATDKQRVLAWLDWSKEMEDNPNNWIGFNGNGEYVGNKHLNPNISKKYIIASRDDKYSTYYSVNDVKDNEAYTKFEALRKSNKSEDVKYTEALEIAKTLTDGSPFNFFLEMRGGSTQNSLFNLLSRTKIIVSSSGRLWDSDGTVLDEKINNKEDKLISDSVPKFKWATKHKEIYLKTFHKEYKQILEDKAEEISEEDKIKKRLFNSVENSDIKLQLYKTIKSIYDKWVPGSNCELELCGDGTSSGDVDNCVQLIDTFSFIDRAYNNIGEDFLVNPVDMVRNMVSDYNISMYDYLARTLVSNNFNFIPLPTFINFNDRSSIEDVFKPNPFNEMESAGGPTFVCMYLGEGSKSLSLGGESQHPDDGFNLNDEECLPPDFKSSVELEGDNNISNKNTGSRDSEPDFSNDDVEANIGDGTESNEDDEGYNIIPAFRVAYGHQNQNFFKNFKLDQSEFTETEESLKIIDELSKNNKSTIGQNMFNVYRTRAYSSTVDMLGNAQIQPFMYFQLDNVPMFTGAYNIIRVKHTIKPNHMSTQFKGVRVRKTKTPLIKNTIIMMNMVGSSADIDFSETSLSDLREINGDSSELNPNLPGKPKWSACISYPVKLKDVGLEVQSMEKIKSGRIVNYTILEVGKLIENSAKDWYNYRKNSKFSDKIFYNDFSKIGGGNLTTHSGHETGLSSDMRPPTNNKEIETTAVEGRSNYDRKGTIELIELILNNALDSGDWTVNTPVKHIFLKDNKVIDYFKNEYEHRDKFRDGGVVRYEENHHDHLHFEFNLPDRIANSESENYIVCGDSGDDNMFPNSTTEDKGELVSMTGNESRPSKEIIEGSLGKIVS